MVPLESVLLLLLGALLPLVGFVVGRLATRRPREPYHVCSCGHELSFHDPATNACHYADVELVNGAHQAFRCACLQYVGSRPLPELNLEELWQPPTGSYRHEVRPEEDRS